MIETCRNFIRRMKERRRNTMIRSAANITWKTEYKKQNQLKRDENREDAAHVEKITKVNILRRERRRNLNEDCSMYKNVKSEIGKELHQTQSIALYYSSFSSPQSFP